MKLWVDFIDTHFCSPLFHHPSQNRSSQERQGDCEVELLFRETGKTDPIQLFLHRLQADQDLFVWAPLDAQDRKEIRYLQENGWNIPHREITHAIRLEYLIKQNPELYPLLVGSESAEALRGDLVSLISFGEIPEEKPDDANPGTYSRILISLYSFTGKIPELAKILGSFLEHQINDPGWNHAEKQRMKWLLLAVRSMESIRDFFPDLGEIPHMEQALGKVVLYWLSPEAKIRDLPRERDLQEAAKQYFFRHQLSVERNPEAPDLFQNSLVFLESLNERGWLKDPTWLQARTNQMQILLHRAVRENWSWLLTLKHPESGIKEGLIRKYANNPAEAEIMRIFSEHVSIVYSGDRRHPDMYFSMGPFSAKVKKLIEQNADTPDLQKAMLRFLSETVLQKLLAQGHNMEIFWDGSFRERVNFYPKFATGFDRPTWAALIDWTRKNLIQRDPQLSQPHVLLNKTALGIDGALTLAGGLTAGLAMNHRGVRIGGLAGLGSGLGAGAANLICFWADLSNRYGQCDLVGTLAGGLLGGLLGAYLLPRKSPPDDMIMPPPPPPPVDPGKRWPVDGFGP